MEDSVGKKIRELRLFYGLEVYAFAFRCKVSPASIYKLEGDKTLRPHFNTIRKIAAAYNVPVGWLMPDLFEKQARMPFTKPWKETITGDYWKKETFDEMKAKSEMLRKEIEQLWIMIDHFTKDEKPNLRKVRGTG